MSDNNYSFGFNQFYPNQGNNGYGNGYGNRYGNGNGGVLNKIGNGFAGIYNNRWILIFIFISIPILTFMIIAFTKKGIQRVRLDMFASFINYLYFLLCLCHSECSPKSIYIITCFNYF